MLLAVHQRKPLPMTYGTAMLYKPFCAKYTWNPIKIKM